MLRIQNPRPAGWCTALMLSVLACTPAVAVDAMQTTLANVTTSYAPSAPGTNLEQIGFSGAATIKSKHAAEPSLNTSVLDLMIDLKGVVGTGKSSGTRYPLTSQYSMTVPCVPNQTIQVIFPIAAGTSSEMSSTRTGLATIAINADPATGAITSVSASLSTR